MKHNYSRVHPDLRPVAQRTPAFLFSHKNLWLTKLLASLTPAPRPPEDIVIQNRFIPSDDQQGKDQGQVLPAKIYECAYPGSGMDARWRIRDGKTGNGRLALRRVRPGGGDHGRFRRLSPCT